MQRSPGAGSVAAACVVRSTARKRASVSRIVATLSAIQKRHRGDGMRSVNGRPIYVHVSQLPPFIEMFRHLDLRLARTVLAVRETTGVVARAVVIARRKRLE